ncbi:MAG: hypothetical protein ACRCSK_00360 [Fusobacteriaceae bacterium]
MKKYLSPHEKIAILRRKYDITQEELAANQKFSKISLALIETKRRGATPNIVKLICENFNEVFKKKNIKDHADFDEIIKSKAEQAKEFLDDLLAKNMIIKTGVTDIDEAIFELESVDNSKYCFTIGKLFFENGNMKYAKYYIGKGMLGHFGKKELHNLKDLILMSVQINNNSGNFEETISMVERYKTEIQTVTEIVCHTIMYYYAVALFETGKVKEAVTILTPLSKGKRVQDKILKLKIKITLAEIGYKNFSRRKKSVKTFFSLLAEAPDNAKREIYFNMLEIGLIDKKIINIEEIIKTLEVSLKSSKPNQCELFKIYLKIAKAYELIKNPDLAKEYFAKALSLSDESITNKMKFDAISSAIKFVFDLGLTKFKKEKNYIESLEKIYKELFAKEKNFEPLTYFIEFYSEWKKFSVKEYLSYYRNIR